MVSIYRAESCPNALGGTKTVFIVVILTREVNISINLCEIPAVKGTLLALL